MQMFQMLCKDMEILCIFENKTESDRDESWYIYDHEGFEVRYLSDGTTLASIKDELLSCDALVNGNYSSKNGRAILKLFKGAGKFCYLQADGGLAVPRGFVIDRAIAHEMHKYNACLSSGAKTNSYFSYYGIPEKSCRTYRFTSFDRATIKNNKELALHKEEYRTQCGFTEETILFSVGQMIPRKGYDILVSAMKALPKDVGLYIAGGEPENNVKKIIDDNNLSNVHFIGYKSIEELRYYYAASDIFVLPTRYDIWGLVINEALSFGLPVVTTDHCVAGLEFNDLTKAVDIVPIEDIDALAQCLSSLIVDKDRQKKMQEDGFLISSSWALEDMADDLYRIFKGDLQ